MEEFQCLPRFPWKMFLYSSTKFGILKPWFIISKPIRFDLGFWQTSKQIYRKLKYWEKVFQKFQRLHHFLRKLVLYLSTKFSILRLSTIIPKLKRFNICFWQTSKQIYRRFKYRERVLEEFQRLPRFLRKMVSCSLNKFWIVKPWATNSKLIRLDLGFWQTSK